MALDGADVLLSLLRDMRFLIDKYLSARGSTA